jgi:hypothetical protein
VPDEETEGKRLNPGRSRVGPLAGVCAARVAAGGFSRLSLKKGGRRAVWEDGRPKSREETEGRKPNPFADGECAMIRVDGKGAASCYCQ